LYRLAAIVKRLSGGAKCRKNQLGVARGIKSNSHVLEAYREVSGAF
jgi:hypothetical protein